MMRIAYARSNARSIHNEQCSPLMHARTHARTYVDFGHLENQSLVSYRAQGGRDFLSAGGER